MRKLCPICSARIIGRADKRYCSDQCRSAANNKKSKDLRISVKKTNAILLRNRMILSQFVEQGIIEIEEDLLYQEGFIKNHFTGQKIIQSYTFNLVYEFAWCRTSEGKIRVQKFKGRERELNRLDIINQVI